MFRKCIFVALMTFVPALSQACDCTNWYLKGFAGLNFLTFQEKSNAELEADVGYALGGSVGYSFPKLVRLEGEFTYRSNDLDKLILKDDGASLLLDLDGRLSSFSYMGNVLYDLPVNWKVVPYVGVGFGGRQQWSHLSVVAFKGTPDDMYIKGKSNNAAYQLIGGLNLALFGSLDTGIEYRFLDSITNPNKAHNHTLALTCQKKF